MTDFGTALAQLKAGRAIARQGWPRKDIAVVIIPGLTIETTGHKCTPYFALGTDDVSVPWTPSFIDVVADDWTVIEPEKPNGDILD